MAEFHQNGGRKYLCSGGILPDLCLTSSAASYEYGMTQGLVISGRMLPEVLYMRKYGSGRVLPNFCQNFVLLPEFWQNRTRILAEFCSARLALIPPVVLVSVLVLPNPVLVNTGLDSGVEKFPDVHM